MAEQKQEWITNANLAKRVQTSKTEITKARKNGFLTARVKRGSSKNFPQYEFPWPQAELEFEKYKEQKRHKTKSATDLNFDVSDVSYKDLKSWEKVVLALEKGAKNAPDMATAYMKAIEQQAKTRLNQIKAMKEESTVIDRGEVQEWAFRMSRSNRDIWLNWPQIVSTRMAEELGVDSKLLHDVLKKYVIKQLERNASMPEDFKGGEDDE